MGPGDVKGIGISDPVLGPVGQALRGHQLLRPLDHRQAIALETSPGAKSVAGNASGTAADGSRR
jgi:hypothetical protein